MLGLCIGVGDREGVWEVRVRSRVVRVRVRGELGFRGLSVSGWMKVEFEGLRFGSLINGFRVEIGEGSSRFRLGVALGFRRRSSMEREGCREGRFVFGELFSMVFIDRNTVERRRFFSRRFLFGFGSSNASSGSFLGL